MSKFKTKIKLLPTQKADAKRMKLTKHLPNYSEAGSGKTFATLAAIRKRGYTTGIVVCPVIALYMWKDSIEAFLGSTCIVISTGKTKLTLPSGETPDFYILTYGMVINFDVWSQLYEAKREALVLDESDACKNPDTKRTKAIYGMNCDGKGGLFDVCKNSYPMTGTPIMKHADDMWSQLRAAFPKQLKKAKVLRYHEFVSMFCVCQVKKFHPRAAPKRVVVATKNPKLLNELIYKDIGAIRHTLAEVAPDMPPITYNTIHIETPYNRELKALLKGLTFEQIIAAMKADEVGMGKAWHTLGMIKVPKAVDYIASVVPKGGCLVGYWHTDVGDSIIAGLPAGVTSARVMGSTPTKRREEIRLAANAGEIDVVVGQMKAMNTAWNLQEYLKRVIIAEDHFSPSFVEQFIKRVWRIGQTSHVQVDFLKADNPIDDAVQYVREAKARTNKKVHDQEA